MKQYDAIIIGFGKGGKLLAAELAERNWKVAIVERSPQMYGGTCVNVGCIPTKALIHESEYAEKRYYDDYKNQSKLYALAVARKDKLVSFLREKNYENVKNKPNITLYDGTASFLSENTIRIVSGKDETILEGKEIFINTGSTPILPAIDGLKESKYVYTSETLLQSNKLPAHLLVIGGGAVGLEFATMYAGFGSHVTLLEAGNRFLPKVDRDIAASMLEALNRKRITDKRGAIVVDNQLRTTAPHVWALGDVKGDEQFDYLSIDDFRIIRNQLFENKKRSTKDRYPIPFAIFTDPPLAHIGLTEEEAMKNGYSIHVARIPAAMIPRARTLHSIDGMLKAIVDIHTGRILGCTLLCADAPEVINTVASIMKTGQRYHFLRDFIFTHPSMNEGLNMLFKPF